FLRHGVMNAGMLGDIRWSYRPNHQPQVRSPERTNHQLQIRPTGKSLMVMAARAVDVAVLEFFGRRGADFLDDDGEEQVLAGHRVVAVDDDFGFVDGGDGHDRSAFGAGGLQHGAGLDVLELGHGVARDGAAAFGVVFAVTVRGLDFDVEAVTEGAVVECDFEARDDGAETLDEEQGLAADVGIDDLSGAVLEGVFDADNGLMRDGIHGGKDTMGPGTRLGRVGGLA